MNTDLPDGEWLLYLSNDGDSGVFIMYICEPN